MPSITRRWAFLFIVTCVFVVSLYKSWSWQGNLQLSGAYRGFAGQASASKWTRYRERYPVRSFRKLPKGNTQKLPIIQYGFAEEPPETKKIRLERRQAVREAFAHAWKGYRESAWGKDEVSPISKESRTTFGGWAATLVDSLDTLHIMGFEAEFDEAVATVAEIDFTTPHSETINVFETTIRYLGGLLAAYDLSGRAILLTKAMELGEMLYVAFDTERRIPVARWNWTSALQGNQQSPEEAIIVAETGSLSLEFTRLSQLTGNPKYYDAISRITDMFHQQQSQTKLPGLWPIVFFGRLVDTTAHNEFSLGAMADSLYEYLPKEYLLLGGAQAQYREMYEAAIGAAKQTLFFQPMTPKNDDLLISGIVKIAEDGMVLKPEGQHLVCFTGGMVAIGAKIFGSDDLDIAKKLVNGCIWAYESMPSGIMPETFAVVPCNNTPCEWDEEKWRAEIKRTASDTDDATEKLLKAGKIPEGFTQIINPSYLLRPEAIEAVFVLYRITGDAYLQEKGWKMFQAIEKATRTSTAHASLSDVTEKTPQQWDKMESFWTAETLKYFYLLFSDPGDISLDRYVLNTEAHPLKRPD